MGSQCMSSVKEDSSTNFRNKERMQTNQKPTNKYQNDIFSKSTKGKQNSANNSNTAEAKLQIKSDAKYSMIKPSENHLYCLICKQKYNKEQRQPVKICQEQHTICSVCKDMLLASKVQRYKICPFCKRLLHCMDIKVNDAVLAMVN